MKQKWVGIVLFAFACASFAWAQTATEFKGHDGLVNSVAFSSDGKILATASFDGTVKLWDFASGKEVAVLKGHVGPVYSVAFNKGGDIVATGGLDKTIRYWNPKDGKFSKELKGHTGIVSSVTFSPDGKYLASGSEDKSVKLWDGMEGKELKTLAGHKESVYCVAFSGDGTLLASCGNDGIIKVWDVKDQKEVKSLMVELPKVETKEEKKKEEKKDEKKDVKKDVKKDEKKDLKKKDMQKKKEEAKEIRDAITVVAFAPDATQILSGGNDKHLRYWSVSAGKETKKLPATPDYIFGLSISRDNKEVAIAGYGGSIRVYEIASGKELFSQQNKGLITYCIAFTPDGRAVVTGHEKGGKGWAKVTPLTAGGKK